MRKLLGNSSLLCAASLFGALVLTGTGCGGDDDTPLADGGTGDTDGGGGGTDAPGGDVTLTGTVSGAPETGDWVPLDGAQLSFRDQSGAVISTASSNADGTFTMTAPGSTLGFLVVEPIGDYIGLARAQETMGGWEVYPVVLPNRALVEREHMRAEIAYDATKGHVAIGINPVSPTAGGEGATLSAAHDPGFVLAEGDVIAGERLPPVCAAGVPDGTDGCTTLMRSNNIFYPNVTGSSTTITPVNPASGTCALRFAPSAWLVVPDTQTNVDLDCVP